MTTQKPTVKRSIKPFTKPPIEAIATSTKAQPAAAKKAPSSKRAVGVVATAKTTAPTPQAAVVVVPKAAKVKGSKLVRDSFTIPKAEYATLDGLKLRAAKLTRPTKKSEVLRAGIAALLAMSDKTFLAALDKVPSLKTGRPKNLET